MVPPPSLRWGPIAPREVGITTRIGLLSRIRPNPVAANQHAAPTWESRPTTPANLS